MLARIVFWMLRRGQGPPPTSGDFERFIRHYHRAALAVPKEENPDVPD